LKIDFVAIVLIL